MRLKIIGTVFIVLLYACNSGSSKKSGNMKDGQDTNLQKADKTIAKPAYKPIPLPKLIGMSDMAVIGKVSEIREDTFVFRIDDYLSIREDSLNIEVSKYIPPAFMAKKHTPYDSTQQFVLFLRKLPRENTPWAIIGIGGEGERPIGDGNVYFEGSYLQDLDTSVYTIQGLEKSAQRINLEQFRDAVQNYGRCFTWKIMDQARDIKTLEGWAPVQVCDESLMNQYRAKSWIHEYLVSQTLPLLGNSMPE